MREAEKEMKEIVGLTILRFSNLYHKYGRRTITWALTGNDADGLLVKIRINLDLLLV